MVYNIKYHHFSEIIWWSIGESYFVEYVADEKFELVEMSIKFNGLKLNTPMKYYYDC